VALFVTTSEAVGPPDFLTKESVVDAKFHPAMAAIKAGDVDRFRALVRDDVTLATSRSSCGHPTLLQCLVLDANDTPYQIEMARILIEAGAELNEPFVACGSGDNVAAAELLLDSGAAIDGTGGWSPLEETLYWNSPRVRALLVQRGASIRNLRIAAGLGRTDVMATFFDADGNLRPEAGTIDWPWGIPSVIEESNFDPHGKNIKQMLAAKVATFRNDRQGIIDNALVYACMHGHLEAATFLLERGAQLNVIPGGFDYSGTALHYAAFNGHRAMVDFLLERGADVNMKDTKIGQTPASWADHSGKTEIRDLLLQRAAR
jgi:ankyrin repeat protein